jgi:hypothetical protein
MTANPSNSTILKVRGHDASGSQSTQRNGTYITYSDRYASPVSCIASCIKLQDLCRGDPQSSLFPMNADLPQPGDQRSEWIEDHPSLYSSTLFLRSAAIFSFALIRSSFEAVPEGVSSSVQGSSSRMPGVSINTPPCGRRMSSFQVVVCRPRESFSRTSWVASESLPKSLLISVDLPAPEEPTKAMVVPTERCSSRVESPVPFSQK